MRITKRRTTKQRNMKRRTTKQRNMKRRTMKRKILRGGDALVKQIGIVESTDDDDVRAQLDPYLGNEINYITAYTMLDDNGNKEVTNFHTSNTLERLLNNNENNGGKPYKYIIYKTIPNPADEKVKACKNRNYKEYGGCEDQYEVVKQLDRGH
jgi:hypothetical protein